MLQMFSKNDRGIDVQISAQPDKNHAQIRREILTRDLRDMLAKEFPQHTFFARREEGSIFESRRNLCTIYITSETSASLQFVHAERIRLSIEEGPIQAKFRVLTGEASP